MNSVGSVNPRLRTTVLVISATLFKCSLCGDLVLFEESVQVEGNSGMLPQFRCLVCLCVVLA